MVVNLFRIPSAPEVTDDCIQNILDLKSQCDALAMPLMIEPLVFKPNAEAGGYQVDGDLDKNYVRQACELGADVIKADPTDNPEDYHQVIQVAGDIPVLVRGGGRVKVRFSRAPTPFWRKARVASCMAAISSSTPTPAA